MSTLLDSSSSVTVVDGCSLRRADSRRTVSASAHVDHVPVCCRDGGSCGLRSGQQGDDGDGLVAAGAVSDGRRRERCRVRRRRRHRFAFSVVRGFVTFAASAPARLGFATGCAVGVPSPRMGLIWNDVQQGALQESSQHVRSPLCGGCRCGTGASEAGRTVRRYDHGHGSAVEEPVEHRRGNGRVAGSSGPVGNTEVGREDRARLQIPLVDSPGRGLRRRRPAAPSSQVRRPGAE